MFEISVKSDEELARFVFDRNQFSTQKQMAKPSAFWPPTGKVETSVYRIDHITVDETFEIGRQFVEPKRGRAIRGFAVVTAGVVFNNELKVIGTELPHPRHANIIGWTGNIVRDREIALNLAQNSKLILAPTW